jgi:hypothetical protein
VWGSLLVEGLGGGGGWPSKLATRVRFPSPAPPLTRGNSGGMIAEPARVASHVVRVGASASSRNVGDVTGSA